MEENISRPANVQSFSRREKTPASFSILKNVTLFKRLTEDELRRLFQSGKVVEFKPQSSVVVEGDPRQGLYLVLEGKLSVHKYDQSHRALSRLAILEEGASFGEMSLLDAAPRSATVIAETFCCLFHLEGEAFQLFLDHAGADVQVRFFKTCAEEMSVRLRTLNADYLESQRLLWRHALRKEKVSSK